MSLLLPPKMFIKNEERMRWWGAKEGRFKYLRQASVNFTWAEVLFL